MKRAGSAESAKYLSEMPKTNYDGVTANIVFDPHGDLTNASISVYTVEGGKWKLMRTVSGPTTPVVIADSTATSTAPATAPAADVTPAAAPAK